MKTIAIVTPIGNEISSIESFYSLLKPFLKENNATWITVFDNYCIDGTDKWLINNKEDNVEVIYNNRKHKGLAGAYIAGNVFAMQHNFAKIIEVDIGHPVELIGKFSALMETYPVVMGTRSINKNGFIRKFISKAGTILSHHLLRLPFTDCTTGLQGFTLDVAKKMPWDDFMSTGHFYQTEFKFYCKNIPFNEISFSHYGGATSLKVKAIIESLKILCKLKNRQPIIWGK